MKKVVLIGIDGLSEPVIDFLLKKNKLPTFKRLINKGARKTSYNINMLNKDPWEIFCVLREYEKEISRIGVHPDLADWTTLATGTTPDKHKLVSYSERTIEGIDLPASARKRKKPALWDILTQYNRKIGIVGWVANWPPPSLPEYTVAKISDVFRPYFTTQFESKYDGYSSDGKNLLCNPAYPSWLWKELEKVGHDKEIDKYIQKVPSYAAFYLSGSLRHESLYLESAKYLLKKFPQPDLFAICLYELHNLSHLFWDCLETEKNNFKGIIHQRRQREFGSIIEDYYQFLDRKINEILQLVDNDSTVIILSNHGMRRSRVTKKYLLMDKIYEKLGFLKFESGMVNLKNTQVYDNRNPWGIFAIRVGYIKDKYPARTFQCLKSLLEGVKTTKGERLFLEIRFNERNNSFSVVPNYKSIHYNTKIILNNEVFPIRKFARFIPHYSLHCADSIFIVSNNIQRFNMTDSTITTLDIFPTILSLLGVKYKDKDVNGKVILKIKEEKR